MKYYVRETDIAEAQRRTAGGKAREDVCAEAEALGFRPIPLGYDAALRGEKGRFAALGRLSRDWNGALSGLNAGDVLLLQYAPAGLYMRPVFFLRLLARLRARGVKIILLVHDVRTLRRTWAAKRQTLKVRGVALLIRCFEAAFLKQGDAVIVHNAAMAEALAAMGVSRSRMVPLGLFDYLLPGAPPPAAALRDGAVIVAGNLGSWKAGYLAELPEAVSFRLYGVNYTGPERDGLRYCGSFPPEELVSRMEGSFGLVWDGPSGDTCRGPLGEYLTVNSPHKLSLYLAAGLPVILWEKAAAAALIRETRAGFTVASLGELTGRLKGLRPEEYAEMAANARKLATALHSGEYGKRAIRAALELVREA